MFGSSLLWLGLVTGVAHAGVERCNGADDDGDGAADEGPVVASVDADGDGYGSARDLEVFPDCVSVGAGLVADVDDCDDAAFDASPAGIETCNAADDDCDGRIDEVGCDGPVATEDAAAWLVMVELVDWGTAVDRCDRLGWHLATPDSFEEDEGLWRSADGWDRGFWIGFTDAATEGTWIWVDGSTGSWTNWQPNEPNNGSSGLQNCALLEFDGQWDDRECEGDPRGFVCERSCNERFWYADDDGDGLGNPAIDDDECAPYSGFVANALDCDDGDPDAPGVWYGDGDGDGWGAELVVACASAVSTALGGDCDDVDGLAWPGAPEVADDGIDQDCDGGDTVTPDPEPEPDTDRDGLTDAAEVAFGTDPTRADTDDDGWNDGLEVELGTDPLAADTDGDGWTDAGEGTGDTDGDGRIDAADPDDDGDGLATRDEADGDPDADGLVNHLDPDSDGDGARDGSEALEVRYDAGGTSGAAASPPSGCAHGSPASPWVALVLLGFRHGAPLSARRRRRFRDNGRSRPEDP